MRMKICLVLIIMMVSVTGCGVYLDNVTSGSAVRVNTTTTTVNTTTTTEATTEPPTEAPVPIGGGTINVSMRTPKTLNPLKNGDVTVDSVLKLVFEPLFVIDESKTVQPNIAQDYSFSADGKTIYISIKNGLQWENSDYITADDVIFSLDTIKNNPQSVYRFVMDDIESYGKNGKNGVYITYTFANSFNIYDLYFPVISKEYYSDKSNENADMQPMGSGGYMFESYRLVKNMVLTNTNGINGTPEIEKINVVITDDRQTDIYAFEQRITDVIAIDVSEWGKFTSKRSISSHKMSSGNFEFIGFNFNNEALANPSVRQAVAYCIPYTEIVNNIYLTNAQKAVVPVNPKSRFYDEKSNDIDYAPNKARELIEQSGIPKQELSFSILVNEENNERTEAAKLIAARLGQAGITVNVDIRDFETYKSMLESGDYTMFAGGTQFSSRPDMTFLFHSQYSTMNYFKFSDKTMDELLQNVRYSTKTEDFDENMRLLQEYAAKQLPCVGICFKDSILLTDSKLQGEINPIEQNLFYNIQNWYFTE